MKQVASFLTVSLVALAVQAEQTQTCERTKVAVLYDHAVYALHMDLRTNQNWQYPGVRVWPESQLQ